MKICLVCSSGGHLVELYRLKGAWTECERFWVSFDGCDSRIVLKDERMIRAYHPTNRNVWNLFRNAMVAWRVLRHERPGMIISTGAGIAIPLFYLARIFRIPTVYVESFTRIQTLSLTGRIVYPVAGRFLVQWPELLERWKKAEYGGQVL